MDILEKIVKHIATHAEREDVFLSPSPGWSLADPHAILDIICDSGVPAETLDAWCVEASKER